MKRPNRDDKKEIHTGEMVKMYNDKHYLQALEKYASTLEEQLLLHCVIEQSKHLVCEHKYQDNICDRRGVRKCMLCGKLEKTN